MGISATIHVLEQIFPVNRDKFRGRAATASEYVHETVSVRALKVQTRPRGSGAKQGLCQELLETAWSNCKPEGYVAGWRVT